MVYIERSITPYVQKAEKNFKAVLITGASLRNRQYKMPECS